MIVPNKKYRAIIKALSSTADGKYEIHVPALMSHDTTFNGCYAKNKTSPYGKWIDPTSGEVFSTGSYIPLQLGQPVEVIFETDKYDSASIVGLIFDQIPLNKDDQDSFYLFGITKNGTQIYSDDKRSLTHIMHHKGTTNVIMMDDKVSISVNETSNVGTNNLSNIEVGAESIILKVGKTCLILDESGITLKTKNNKFEFGNKEFNFKTSKFNIDANDVSIVSDKIFINSNQETHIKSNVTRVTGSQQLALTGVTVNVSAENNLTLQSQAFLNMKSNLNCYINCPTNIEIVSVGMVSLIGTQTHVDGQLLSLNGTTVGINGATVGIDGQILTNMGVGTGVCGSAKATAISLGTSLEAANVSLTTALHLGDVGTGSACNTLANTIPGTAQSAPNPMAIPTVIPRFDYINTCLQYMNTNIEIGNIGTYDIMNSLNGNYLPNVYYKSKGN